MDPTYIALITIAAMIISIVLGVYVGVALALTSMVGLWLITGDINIAMGLIGSTAYRGAMEYIFGTVPLFVLMGSFANLSGISREIYDAAAVVFARVRGGLGITTVIANAIFAALTGVSIASAAIFSKIAVPQMKRLGYEKKFSLGTVATSSILGMLIPPSLLFIVYGILTEEAIGTLFLAGVIPGILVTILLCGQVILTARLRPALVGGDPRLLGRGTLGSARRLRIVIKLWPVAALVLLVLGGLYSGYFTPTEAGAIGASGTFLLTCLKRRLTRAGLWQALLDTGYTMAAVFLLFLCAQMYSRMLTISGLPFLLSEWASALDVPPMVVILIFCGLFLLLGVILDSTSILLVTIPLMAPVVETMGFNLIWFGVVSVVAIEVGLITPPFGMVVFAMKAALGEEATVEEIFRGSLPFILTLLSALGLLLLFPGLSLWLPEILK